MMLNARKWKSQEFQAYHGEYIYTFAPKGLPGTLAQENLSMAPIGLWSEHWKLLLPDCDTIEWIYPEQEIIHLLVKTFKLVPQVQSICAQFGQEEITVWTLLESYDREARTKVHTKELEICRELKVYDFDFRVSSVELVSPKELCDVGLREIYRRM